MLWVQERLPRPNVHGLGYESHLFSLLNLMLHCSIKFSTFHVQLNPRAQSVFLSPSTMAIAAMRKTLSSINPSIIRTLTSHNRPLSSLDTATQPEPESEAPSFSSFTFSSDGGERIGDEIHLKSPKKKASPFSSTSVTMPMLFMTGSIVGKRFYKKVTTRESDDGVGWHVMLDYRTLKTPSKRPLKCPTLSLAKAIAAEWEYQVCHCVCVCDSIVL